MILVRVLMYADRRCQLAAIVAAYRQQSSAAVIDDRTVAADRSSCAYFGNVCFEPFLPQSIDMKIVACLSDDPFLFIHRIDFTTAQPIHAFNSSYSELDR